MPVREARRQAPTYLYYSMRFPTLAITPPTLQVLALASPGGEKVRFLQLQLQNTRRYSPDSYVSQDCGRCAPPRPQWHAGLTSGHRVYGGYRESLGRYRVTLDRNSTEYDGFTGGPDVPGYQLFSAPNLPMGQHHISMFNIGNDPAQPMLDFSYVRTSH